MALNVSLDFFLIFVLGEVSKEVSAREALLKLSLRNQELYCSLYNRYISLPSICLKAY